jgi:chemotaxis protein histidine kinase CheA
MAEEQLRGVIDSIRARLQAELEQLGNLAHTHEQAVQEARQRADADAEERWASKLDAVHAQWGSRLESEVSSARADVERALAADAMRARMEAEQVAAEAAVHARRQLDEAVAAERARAQAEIERAQEERTRAQAELQRAQADLERLQAERERAYAERQTAQDDLSRAQADRERTQADLARVHAEREQAQQDLQRAHADREGIENALRQAESDHQRAQEDLQRAQADRERAQGDFQRANSERDRAQEALQSAQEALARAQRDLQQAHADAQTIREDAARELAETLERHVSERLSAVDALANAQHAAESMPRSATELLNAMRAISDASSLTDALEAAVRGAALECPRTALFIVNGTTLQEWPVDGVPPVDAGPIRSEGREAGFLAEVLKGADTVTIDGTNGRTAPMFAGLSPGRRAIAVPMVLDGRPVAVLYADEGSDGQPLASWLETVQILGRHATSVVASLTAVRTAQAMGYIAGRSRQNGTIDPADAAGVTDANHDEVQSARRYAKLLVSEIKLYNEGAVRVGRERRDLRTRLQDEIDRARRLYDQRVPASLGGRDAYFRQELVQTLADGDQSLFD